VSGEDYDSVYNQWLCHSYLAMPDKIWDLEIGTPNFGFWGTVNRKCNPHLDRMVSY